MKTNTSILLAALIGASSQAGAHDVNTPQRIIDAANESIALSRDITVVGKLCYRAKLYGVESDACDKARKAIAQVQRSSATVSAWLEREKANGATRLIGFPDYGTVIDESTAVINDLIRVYGYE